MLEPFPCKLGEVGSLGKPIVEPQSGKRGKARTRFPVGVGGRRGEALGNPARGRWDLWLADRLRLGCRRGRRQRSAHP